MENDQYITVVPLTETPSQFWKDFSDLWRAINWKLHKAGFFEETRSLRHIALLQVDATRAGDVFSVIHKQLRLDWEKGIQLIRDLATAAINAYTAVAHSAPPSDHENPPDVFGRSFFLLVSELHYKSPPPPAYPVANAKDFVFWRDGATDKPRCPFTGTSKALQSPLLYPTNEGESWMWLWLAVILPEATHHAAFKSAGSTFQQCPANLMTMGAGLTRRFKDLTICFKPIVDNPAKAAFRLELQYPPNTVMDLSHIRRVTDGAPVRNGMQFVWWPRDGSGQETAPSPLLLSLHRYMVVCAHDFEALAWQAERRRVEAERRYIQAERKRLKAERKCYEQRKRQAFTLKWLQSIVPSRSESDEERIEREVDECWHDLRRCERARWLDCNPWHWWCRHKRNEDWGCSLKMEHSYDAEKLQALWELRYELEHSGLERLWRQNYRD